jgi:hypothetical protein
VSAERRREGRRALRHSVEAVAKEILRHARVGDGAAVPCPIELPETPSFHLYKVERVNWLVETPPQYGEEAVTGWDPEPTLVQYTLELDHEQGLSVDAFLPSERYYGAVLLDVRHELTHYDEKSGAISKCTVVGREVSRESLGHERTPYDAELHLATDDELLTFANEALDVVHGLAKNVLAAQTKYATAAEKLTKLAPK